MQILGENKYFLAQTKIHTVQLVHVKLRSTRWLLKHKGEFCEPPIIIRHYAVIYAKETTRRPVYEVCYVVQLNHKEAGNI
jgi:hypothetical protein